MTAPVSGRFRNNEVKKNISAGGSRRPEIFFPSKSYSRISSSGRLGSKGGRMGMMRKLSPRGERQLTCPHISASSQRRICTAVAQLVLEFIRVAHNSPLSQGCLRLEGNSRQHEQLG